MRNSVYENSRSSALSLAPRADTQGGGSSRETTGRPNGRRCRLSLSTERRGDDQDALGRRPKVTVITPTYNRPAYLPDAIRSVLNQELQDWELFVINDGGCDVRHIVDRFPDRRITYINRNVNRGKAACLNECLGRARGEYVAYLDDDDIWYSNHLSVLAEALDSHPEAGVAYSDLYRVVCVVGEDGRRFPLEKKVEVCRDYNRTFMWHFNHTLHVSLMHRLELARKVGGYHEDIRVLIDWDLTRKLSFYTDFVHVARATGEYYDPVTNSDRISDVQRENHEEFLHNLRRVRSDLPPEPWPKVERVLIVRPMQAWDGYELAAVRELTDRIDHPCRIALVNTCEGMTLEQCRTRVGRLAELRHISIEDAPGADMARAYAVGAASWQSDYCYLAGDRMVPGEALRVIRALGYMRERGVSTVRWEADPVDSAESYDVLVSRAALPEGDAIPSDLFADADIVPSQWPTEAGERRRFALEQDMLLLCANACEENGAWERSQQLLDEAEGLRQGALRGPYLVHRRLQVAMQLGDFERAEAMCRNLIDRGYGADNYVRLGMILQHTERYVEAEASYRKALEVLGLRKEDLDRPELRLEGEECDAFRAMIGLGECLVAQEKDDEAGRVLRRAAGLCANSHRPALAFGRMFLRQGNLRPAEQALEMARGKDCGEALADIDAALSRVYECQGRTRAAYDAARSALKSRPDAPALMSRAVALAQCLGRGGDVEHIYRSFLELRPGNVSALNGLAEICRSAGRREEAERLSETAALLSAATG